jgi:neutral ceramidase
VGGRSAVASADYPGPAREVLERNLGGLALFLQGCGGNINPRVGIGYEVDCRDTKNRVGLELGGEALTIAAGIRTNTRAGDRRPLGNVPNILFTPWEPVHGDTCTHLAAAETTVALEFDELPSTEKAREILAHWQRTREERLRGDALDWEIRAAQKYEHWATALVAAVEDGHPTHDLRLQAIRVNDVLISAMNMEVFYETGLEIRSRSPLPDTFVLGYTNGCFGYLPRGEDYPEGGWQIDESYAVPDLIPQAWAMPVILHPGSARRAVEASLELIEAL